MAVVIATTLGCVALLCVVSWPFFSDYRTVVKIQSAGAAAFALYFLMLGSPTAAIACLISCSQLVISGQCAIAMWLRDFMERLLFCWPASRS